MPLGRRTQPDPLNDPLPAPARPPVSTPVPEVDKYADKPYISPSIRAAMDGKQVNFGTDVFEDTATTDS